MGSIKKRVDIAHLEAHAKSMHYIIATQRHVYYNKHFRPLLHCPFIATSYAFFYVFRLEKCIISNHLLCSVFNFPLVTLLMTNVENGHVVMTGKHTVYRMSAANTEDKDAWMKCIR